MMLFAATPSTASPNQIGFAVALAALAAYWLLPKPRGRSVALGTFAALGAAAVLVSWIAGHFGPAGADWPAELLFWIFGSGAVVGAAGFVVQRNPARGAIAFAFVILSVCGLFLLLAAPFLAAATVIIYAGAVIVTFLFVLMLSHNDGPSDENDRSREPLLGALGAFALTGLILFSLHLASDGSPEKDAAFGDKSGLPAVPVSYEERTKLLAAAEEMRLALDANSRQELDDATRTIRGTLADVVGPPSGAAGLTIPDRLAGQADLRSRATLAQAKRVRELNRKTFDALENALLGKPTMNAPEARIAAAPLAALRREVLLLSGQGELPARNVANVGYALYADHLLAVEMAGTLLLVATIGAVLIASRKGASA